MKREVTFILIFMFLLLSVSLISASEEEQVEKAYTCLENRINQSNCSALSFEEKVFSLLAVERCQNEVMLENLSNNCWPKSSCKIKSTAQAVLALDTNGVNTTKAENWLLMQTATPTDMEWFLEIESLSATTCTITYSDSSYTISISQDKKVSANAGNYLTLAQDNYWLKISPSIYNKNISISCDKSFITTLLFKKKESSTIHVSETVHSAAAGGRTSEKVDSFCFSPGGACDYEGSLWATFVLYSLNYDVSKFMPYLITMMDDDTNKAYLPESFLYFLTGKFRTDLLLKQKAGLYWEESGDKYYDTALALWPFYYESPLEKENSKSWLLDVQQSTGCWNNGNLRDTAFILYSIWPRSVSPPYGECDFNSDCSEVSCKEATCDDGVCFYDYFNCEDNDDCCNPGCTVLTDDDCGSENQCDSDLDCSIYVSESDKYCSDDKTKVYKEISDWSCDNHICVEETTEELVETCDAIEQCYVGSCLSTEDIPDECVINSDCDSDEICDGYGNCVSASLDCAEEGYYCMSDVNCEGNYLYDYDCTGVFVCCDTEVSLEICSDEGGDICANDETCTGGTTVEVSDTVYGETCCVGGTCEEEVIVTSDCGNNDGICRSSCNKDEKENSLYDCDSGNTCCVEKETTESSKAWLWILLALILISALGIVFRDKLRTQWLKLKTKFGKKDNKKRFEMPLTTHPNFSGRTLSRGILPPQLSRPPMHRPLPTHSLTHKKPEEKPKNELDDVLKKLKEMGK